MTELFLNHTVQLWPNDTYTKYGIIIDINAVGIVVEIVKSDSMAMPVGSIHFIAYAKSLTFKLVD